MHREQKNKETRRDTHKTKIVFEDRVKRSFRIGMVFIVSLSLSFFLSFFLSLTPPHKLTRNPRCKHEFALYLSLSLRLTLNDLTSFSISISFNPISLLRHWLTVESLKVFFAPLKQNLLTKKSIERWSSANDITRGIRGNKNNLFFFFFVYAVKINWLTWITNFLFNPF